MTSDTVKRYPNLVIEGMKHCGKSTHGRFIAQSLGWGFIDTDELIIEGMEKQMINRPTIREVYELLGEEKFGQLECGIIRGLSQNLAHASQRVVISLGGRVPTHSEIRAELAQLGYVIYLKSPPDILYFRSTRRGPVSFLDPLRPQEHFYELYEQRDPQYRACADLVIEVGNIPHGEAHRLILGELEKHFGQWLK